VGLEFVERDVRLAIVTSGFIATFNDADAELEGRRERVSNLTGGPCHGCDTSGCLSG